MSRHFHDEIRPYENDIRFADFRHPADTMEPIEHDNASEQGSQIIAALMWIDSAGSPESKKRRILALMERNSKEDRNDPIPHNPDSGATESECIPPVPSNPRVSGALTEILAWALRGETDGDVAVRISVIMRVLEITPWRDRALSEIGFHHGVSKQRIKALMTEFQELYMKGA